MNRRTYDPPNVTSPPAPVPVPHVARDLVPLNLANPIPGSSPTTYRVTAEGQERIYAAMRQNAEAAL